MSSSESRPFCLELNLFRKRTVFDHFHWDNAYGTISCTGDIFIFSLGSRRWSQEWTKEWWPCWLNFGPLVAKYGGFRPLSDKVFKQSNSNLWCTLLGWVFITDLLLSHIGPILAFIRQKKTTENDGFRPLSDILFPQSNSNLWCTLLGWVFRTDSLLGTLAQFWASGGQKITFRVSDHYLERSLK